MDTIFATCVTGEENVFFPARVRTHKAVQVCIIPYNTTPVCHLKSSKCDILKVLRVSDCLGFPSHQQLRLYRDGALISFKSHLKDFRGRDQSQEPWFTRRVALPLYQGGF